MDICKVILFDIATIFRPKIMQWTKEHDDLLVKEVLALDPYSSPKGSTERSNVWDSIAGHLNACSYVKFAVSGRSVKDRLQLVLIRNYKRKMSEEIRASGIEVDGLSDFETAMEEIAEKFDASEKDAANQSEDKKDKSKKEKKQAEETRNQALERIGETKKRKVDEADESRDQNSLKSRRRQGNEIIIYLKQKAEQDIKVRQEELQLKRDAQVAQENHQKDMMQHLMKQHNQQMSLFNAFQQQQQQQMQQMSQIQMSFIQQQQQQSQTLLSVLKELAQKNK